MITIVDLGISNIKSIARGFVTQGFEVTVTTGRDEVAEAASLVLPGVGAFPKAVELLKGNGLWEAILTRTRGAESPSWEYASACSFSSPTATSTV